MILGTLRLLLSPHTRSAVSAFKPWVRLAVAHIGNVPSVAWADPYIVGLITTLITLQVRRTSRNRVRGEYLSRVVLTCWSQITGQSPLGLGLKTRDWVYSRDPQFNEGADNAVKLFRTAYSKPDMFDPIVANAMNNAARVEPDLVFLFGASQNDHSNRRGAAVALLWDELFVVRLRLAAQKVEARQI
jgi:hypothetical protein